MPVVFFCVFFIYSWIPKAYGCLQELLIVCSLVEAQSILLLLFLPRVPPPQATDMINEILESYPKKRKILVDEIGLEEDAEAGLDSKTFS